MPVICLDLVCTLHRCHRSEHPASICMEKTRPAHIVVRILILGCAFFLQLYDLIICHLLQPLR